MVRSCRVAQLLNDVPDTHLAGMGFVGGGESLHEADRLGLVKRPAEHRVRHRLQQALAHLGSADAGQRVQPRRTAGLQAQHDAAEGVHEL